MKYTTINKIVAFVLISLFSHFSMADNASAAEDIAGVVASMNHFPSDADKATLMMISEDDSLDQRVRDMAFTVASIQHFANDAGKEAMALIVADEDAPARGRALAGIIASFAHMASDADKATLEEMF